MNTHPGVTPEYYPRLERPSRNKCFILIGLFVIDEDKTFFNIDTWISWGLGREVWSIVLSSGQPSDPVTVPAVLLDML